MTAAENNNSTLRTNAAGEKYSLRGIYGSEPYWPEAKLKICVTGAGGFIGALCRFLFAFVRLCNWAIFSLLCVTSSSSSSSSIFWFLCLVVGRRSRSRRFRRALAFACGWKRNAPRAVVVYVVFSLDRVEDDDDDEDHPYKNAAADD